MYIVTYNCAFFYTASNLDKSVPILIIYTFPCNICREQARNNGRRGQGLSPSPSQKTCQDKLNYHGVAPYQPFWLEVKNGSKNMEINSENKGEEMLCTHTPRPPPSRQSGFFLGVLCYVLFRF